MDTMVSEEEMNGDNTRKKEEAHNSNNSVKCCADCKTTKTPLWRSGPSGPKSLCNACGIRYRKRRASAGSCPAATSPERKRERSPEAGKGAELGESVRVSLVQLSKDLMLHSWAAAKKQRCQRKRKLGEEELAAVSLMAMSCGSVFA